MHLRSDQKLGSSPPAFNGLLLCVSVRQKKHSKYKEGYAQQHYCRPISLPKCKPILGRDPFITFLLPGGPTDQGHVT